MANIETVRPPLIRPLTEADLQSALRLSAAAHWNQNEADWRGMLARGHGWGIEAEDPGGVAQLAASTVVLPYGDSFAWLSMVLVSPAHQRRGYASLLLRHALAWLAAHHRTAVLDATPAGHAVYAREGFADSWGFARYRREHAATAPPRPQGPPTRPLHEGDWPAIAALDLPAFGADRLPLLRALAQRWPAVARVAENGAQLRGFMLGRDGREAHQIGPLIASDLQTARCLIADALQVAQTPVYLDLLDRCAALLPWLQTLGFAEQRRFTRMVWGSATAPGDAATVVAVAGPELG